MNIRAMLLTDMPEVLLIENNSFEYPWNEAEFVEHINQHTINVVVTNNRVVGYVALYVNSNNYTEIINLAILPSFRRKGVASILIQHCIQSEKNIHKFVAMIRESNLTAQIMFRNLGFRCNEIKYNIYTGSDEAAYQFEYYNDIPISTKDRKCFV